MIVLSLSLPHPFLHPPAEPPFLLAHTPSSTRCLFTHTVACPSRVNQGRREFTSDDVSAALGERSAERALWSALEAHQAGVPLTKTLEASLGGTACALYQFKHLSFQVR